MSYAEFQTFANQAIALDVKERIELITFLVKSLAETESTKNSQIEVEKINAVLAKIPVSEQIENCVAP